MQFRLSILRGVTLSELGFNEFLVQIFLFPFSQSRTSLNGSKLAQSSVCGMRALREEGDGEVCTPTRYYKYTR